MSRTQMDKLNSLLKDPENSKYLGHKLVIQISNVKDQLESINEKKDPERAGAILESTKGAIDTLVNALDSLDTELRTENAKDDKDKKLIENLNKQREELNSIKLDLTDIEKDDNLNKTDGLMKRSKSAFKNAPEGVAGIAAILLSLYFEEQAKSLAKIENGQGVVLGEKSKAGPDATAQDSQVSGKGETHSVPENLVTGHGHDHVRVPVPATGPHASDGS